MGQFISSRNASKPNNRNGLILYYHPLCYYSQKVLFVLNEKKISCTLYEIDVSNGEQYTNWFMQINPKMEVPVLQNETLIVPSSNQIITYLEANFVDTHATLLPMTNRSQLEQVISLHRKISQIPIRIISLGTIIHPKIVSSPQLPFIAPLRSSILNAENEMLNRLENTAKSDPVNHDTLLMKVKMQRDKAEVIRDPEEFQKLIDAVGILLTELNDLLQQQSNASNEWLCGSTITLADVSLGILLHRLHQLGLAKYFWGGKQKPFLSIYYNQMTKRESFQKSLPTRTAKMKAVWIKLPYSYKVCAVGIPTIIVGIIIYNI